MRRRYGVLLLWCGWAAAVGGQTTAPDDGAAKRPAEQRPAAWAGRLRATGAEASFEGVRFYQRVDGGLGRGWRGMVLTEKDPGERRWADYAAGYVLWEGRQGQFLLGDMRPGLAQGLVWGRAAGRGGKPLPRRRRDSAMPGKRSSTESGGIRGIALRTKRGGWTGGLWAGRGRWDGWTDQQGRVVGLRTDGVHVSARQRQGRDVLAAQVGGARLRYSGRRGALGGVLAGLRFGRAVDLRRRDRPWAFVGGGQLLYSLDGVLNLGGAWLYGEVAVDPQRARAWTAGLARRRARGRVALQAWRYGAAYRSFYGGGLGGGDSGNQEGASAHILRRWDGALGEWYGLAYRRLEKLTAANALDGKALWGGRLRFYKGRVAWEGRYEESGRFTGGGTEHDRQIRAQGQLLDQRWQTAARVQWRRVGRSGRTEHGWLAGLRAGLDLGCCTGGLQLSLYRTASYLSRLYEYERGLPGAAGIWALYGRGWRLNGDAAWKRRRLRLSLYWRLDRRAGSSALRGGLQADWKAG